MAHKLPACKMGNQLFVDEVDLATVADGNAKGLRHEHQALLKRVEARRRAISQRAHSITLANILEALEEDRAGHP